MTENKYGTDTYNPLTNYLVASSGQSYLVRGNIPLLATKRTDSNLTGYTFAYDDLNTKLKSLIGGFSTLHDYELLDVSIISNQPLPPSPLPPLSHSAPATHEGLLLDAEFLAYGATMPRTWPPTGQLQTPYGTKVAGSTGSMIWYPVQGCMGESNCTEIEPYYLFIPFIDYLHKLLNEDKKRVIYFHCWHGDDRTSAAHAAYMLKYILPGNKANAGMTLQKAVTQVLKPIRKGGAKDIPPGVKVKPWSPNYQNLVEFYAHNAELSYPLS